MVHFNDTIAKRMGDEIGVDWNKVDLEEFNKGLNFEMQHRKMNLGTQFSPDDLHLLAQTAWKHLKDIPDYYTRLGRMEKNAAAFWKKVNSISWKTDIC